jgi:hypothetical protein
MMAQPERVALESGEWEGEYIDAAGHRGKLSLKLEATSERVTGSYELAVRAEDRQQIIRGEIEGLHSENRVEMQLRLGESKEAMKYSAQVSSARSHAEQAMFGLVSAAPGSDFEGGVWIAWRYRGSGG